MNIIKCDASFKPFEQIAKIAYVDLKNGSYKTKNISAKNITKAEFRAIKLAVKKLPKDIEAIICNDNKAAIQKARTSFAKKKHIQFVWIPRKHNELADALTHNNLAKAKKIKNPQSIKIRALKNSIKALKNNNDESKSEEIIYKFNKLKKEILSKKLSKKLQKLLKKFKKI